MKIKLTKEQIKLIAEMANIVIPYVSHTLEITEDQIVKELTNREMWAQILEFWGFDNYFENKTSREFLSEKLDELGIDATEAYDKIVKGGE